jgi:CCR4-NOT transcription complex subunit 4
MMQHCISLLFYRCAYDLCLLCRCYHQLINDPDSKCPACRTPFVPGGVQAAMVAPKAVAAAAHAQSSAAQIAMRNKKNANSNKERQTTAPITPAHGKDISAQLVNITGAGPTPLSDVRIVQRNLAYVVGLSSACGREELLRKREWFGGFGKSQKVLSRRYSLVQQKCYPSDICLRLLVSCIFVLPAVRWLCLKHSAVLEMCLPLQPTSHICNRRLQQRRSNR